MAGIYNGHLLEFPQIRVDCFTSPSPTSPWHLPRPVNEAGPSRQAPPAQLYLLTHVHSDHLIGLSNDFTGKIVCSPDTKRMLLKLEAEVERKNIRDGTRERGIRKYEGLKRRMEGKGTKEERIVDRIEAIPYGFPKEYDLGYEDGKPVRVTITLLDANHCPGSAMFLTTSSKYAVLHTGDIRADNLFMKTLRRQPALGQFFVSPSHRPMVSSPSGQRRLDRIYIDTSAVLGTGDMPDKEEVLSDLVEQMSLYPEETIFFLNVWCFGWEDVVKEVARYFNCQVHVDRYKSEIYRAVKSDPFLSACTSLDEKITRFHACERQAKCSACRTFNKAGQREWNKDKLVVHVNTVEVKTAEWEVAKSSFLNKLGEAAIGDGPWPYNIDCPIARHSPLPELQTLVKKFNPLSISPNTMLPQLNGLDYYLLPELFREYATEDCISNLTMERDIWFEQSPRFGKAYQQYMASFRDLKSALNSGIPKLDNGMADRDELIPENVSSNDNKPSSSQSMGRGRRAHAMDQVSRSLGSLGSALGLHFDADLKPDIGVDVLDILAKAPVKLEEQWPFTAYTRKIRLDEEYDTDEEEEISRRKKRRVTNIKDEAASPQRDALSITRDGFGAIHAQNKIPHSASHVDIKHQHSPAEAPEDVKPDINVKSEHQDPPLDIIHPSTQRRSRKSTVVQVDKAHLKHFRRAFSVVASADR